MAFVAGLQVKRPIKKKSTQRGFGEFRGATNRLAKRVAIAPRTKRNHARERSSSYAGRAREMQNIVLALLFFSPSRRTFRFCHRVFINCWIFHNRYGPENSRTRRCPLSTAAIPRVRFDSGVSVPGFTTAKFVSLGTTRTEN